MIAVGSRADRPDYDDTVAPHFEVFDLADTLGHADGHPSSDRPCGETTT